MQCLIWRGHRRPISRPVLRRAISNTGREITGKAPPWHVRPLTFRELRQSALRCKASLHSSEKFRCPWIRKAADGAKDQATRRQGESVSWFPHKTHDPVRKGKR